MINDIPINRILLNAMKECEVCGAQDFSKIQAKERMFGLNDPFEYLECNSCKGLFLKNIPTDMSDYYPTNYYSFGGFNTSAGLWKFLKRVRYMLFTVGINPSPPVYFDWIKKLNAKKGSKIADIGCGNGQLLEELSYCGFENLHGFDPFLDEEKSSNRIKMRKLDFYDIEEKFDIVMFHHSFEHIPNPAKIFEKLTSILNPNGQAVIRVPVTDGKVWKEEREFWFQLDAPRHIFIPNTLSMKKLADKYSLDLYTIVFDSLASQFWGTELYKRGKPLVGTDPRQEFSSEELDKYNQKAKQYNNLSIGDQACFYFRKGIH